MFQFHCSIYLFECLIPVFLETVTYTGFQEAHRAVSDLPGPEKITPEGYPEESELSGYKRPMPVFTHAELSLAFHAKSQSEPGIETYERTIEIRKAYRRIKCEAVFTVIIVDQKGLTDSAILKDTGIGKIKP